MVGRGTFSKNHSMQGTKFWWLSIWMLFYFSFWEHRFWQKSMSWFSTFEEKPFLPFSRLNQRCLMRGRDARCGFAGFCQQAGPDVSIRFFGVNLFSLPKPVPWTCFKVPALKMGWFPGGCQEKTYGFFEDVRWICLIFNIKKSKLFVDGFRNLAITTWWWCWNPANHGINYQPPTWNPAK